MPDLDRFRSHIADLGVDLIDLPRDHIAEQHLCLLRAHKACARVCLYVQSGVFKAYLVRVCYFALGCKVAGEINNQVGRVGGKGVDTSHGVGYNGHVGSDRAVIGVQR